MLPKSGLWWKMGKRMRCLETLKSVYLPRLSNWNAVFPGNLRPIYTWVEEIKRLSSIGTTQPHSAFSAFTHGFASWWMYLSQTTSSIANLLKPLKKTRQLPSRHGYRKSMRNKLLPVHHEWVDLSTTVSLILDRIQTYIEVWARNNAKIPLADGGQNSNGELNEQLSNNLRKTVGVCSEKGIPQAR